jgi:hypothetical protein
MTELHKRFPINIEEVIIRQYDHISDYPLIKKYAASNKESEETYKFIHDTVFEPFKDNVLKIEQVYNELGVEIPLNEEVDFGEREAYGDIWYEPYMGRLPGNHGFQVARTPAFNVLQILPHPIEGNNLLIKYRAANKPIILSDDIIPGEVEIDVPLAMLEPLLLYVGGRMYSNMHGDNPNSGMGYIQHFELSCQKIEDLNLFNKGNVTNTKLERAGWV